MRKIECLIWRYLFLIFLLMFMYINQFKCSCVNNNFNSHYMSNFIDNNHINKVININTKYLEAYINTLSIQNILIYA